MNGLLRSGPLRGLVLAAALSALTVAAGIGLMGTSGWLIARAAQHPEASALTLAAVGVRALGLGRGVLRYAERLVGHDAVLGWMARTRVVVFQRLARSSEQWRTSQALGALGRDVEGLQELWLRGALPCTAAVVVALGSGAAATAVLPAAGAVLGAGLLVAVALLPTLAWVLAGRRPETGDLRAAHLDALTDLLHGSADLIAYGGTAGALARVDACADRLSREASRAGDRAAVLAGAGAVVQGLTTAAVVWTAGSAVSSGVLQPVWAVVLGLVALASFEPAAGLADAAVALREGHASVRRLSGLLGQGTDVLPSDEAPLAHAAVLVRARGARLDRPGRARPAVAGVDLDLTSGRSWAVLGGSGAGKSSLLALLSGQLAPTAGEVTCGSGAVSALSQAERPRHVVLVEQDAHVFDTTLRDNLRLARPDATDDELLDALRTVGLGPWWDSLPLGLETQLAHRGDRLSGGQRRRLAVARGLLSAAPVLLLDEPTEGLAPDEADELLDDVLAAARDRAVVVVTHRLSVLDRVDELLVLDRGRVVLRGTPEQVRHLPGLVRDAEALLAPEGLLAG